MPGWVGADVDQLRALSRRFTAAADQLRAVVTQTSGRLNTVRWTGADADRFRSEWRGDATGRLRTAADALDQAAEALRRNADEQEQASSAGGVVNGSGFGSGPPRPAWGWPGDVGTTPWFLRPGGGFADPGGMTLPGGGDGAAPTWSFPNPFGEYRDIPGKTPVWPISAGTAVDAAGGGAHYLGGAAVSQWGDVVGEFSKADFSKATVASTVDFITAHPGQAFEAARDAVVDYIPKLISNFTLNPFGK